MAGPVPAKAGVPAPPTWDRLPGALAVCTHRPNRRRTLSISAVVGTVLVTINQSGPLVRGNIHPLLLGRIALDYLIPFLVSNLGVLSASRRPQEDD